MHSTNSAGRKHAELPHPYRGPYQRDRDRILHSAAFRRLSGKTQVFTGSMGDYHRTRLTHTMEVASIARTLGRALRANEDLIEALALLHDIGHPPFGHAGEDALAEFARQEGGFSHNQYALTLVTEIERPYPGFPGLNLSREVLEGQGTRAAKESVGNTPLLEVQVVDLADSITYDAHDTDDAVKLGWLQLEELAEIPLIAQCWRAVTDQFGTLDGRLLRRAIVRELINCQVEDVLGLAVPALAAGEWASAQALRQSPFRLAAAANLEEKKKELERFLHERVYRHPKLVAARGQAQRCLSELAGYFTSHPQLLPLPFADRVAQVGVRRSVVDYLAGMTDRFCLQQYESHMPDA
jgi:dGTPase